MKNAEAIKILSETPVAYPDPDAQSIWDEALSMAISALEKQDGKKPLPHGEMFECENCGSRIIPYADYCCRCGQRISWSDEHGTD